MHNKFDKLLNEYIVGTQNTIPQTMVSIAPFSSGGTKNPPDTGTGLGHTKKLQKSLKRDKIRKRENEKQVRRTIKEL
jgi:hypothetical protein